MVDPPVRYRVDVEPPNGEDREWEVFVRDGGSDPLRRTGSVRAPSVEEAYELATRLFAWYARDVWVCPAAEIARYATDGPERRARVHPERRRAADARTVGVVAAGALPTRPVAFHRRFRILQRSFNDN